MAGQSADAWTFFFPATSILNRWAPFIIFWEMAKRFLRFFLTRFIPASCLTILVLAGVLIFLASRRPDVTKLFESPCAPPCWYRITPGITSRQELEDLVETFPYYEQSETYWRGQNWNIYSDIFTLEINEPPKVVGVDFYMLGDTVGEIHIYESSRGFFGRDLLSFELKDAVDKFGEPDQLVAGIGCGGDVGCTGIYLLYADLGVVVKVVTNTFPPDLEITEDLPVRHIIYIETDDYVDKAIQATGEGFHRCWMEKLGFEWQGYGPVNVEHTFRICDQR